MCPNRANYSIRLTDALTLFPMPICDRFYFRSIIIIIVVILRAIRQTFQRIKTRFTCVRCIVLKYTCLNENENIQNCVVQTGATNSAIVWNGLGQHEIPNRIKSINDYGRTAYNAVLVQLDFENNLQNSESEIRKLRLRKHLTNSYTEGRTYLPRDKDPNVTLTDLVVLSKFSKFTD